jgi:shikimate dehydrogenase
MKFALLGKNIQHSRSPEIYRKLITTKHSYDLLDYDSENEIPSLDELKKKYRGINITTPYKKLFTNDVLYLDDKIRDLKAINCIGFSIDGIYGTNTDYLALKDLWPEILKKYNLNLTYILGSGVMCNVLNQIAISMQLDTKIIARINNHKINEYDYLSNSLVINSCSRDFTFNGTLSSTNIFWDLNYGVDTTKSNLLKMNVPYIDGQELLNLQAQYAVRFWNEIK